MPIVNRADLIKSALGNQRHLALETPVTGIEDLPDDLLTALVDCGNSADYKLHGFLISERKTTVCLLTATGETVRDDRMAVLCGEARIEIWRADGRKEIVARDALGWREESTPWWFAVVEGSGVVLETELRDRGFPAFSGAPAYVAVRPA